MEHHRPKKFSKTVSSRTNSQERLHAPTLLQLINGESGETMKMGSHQDPQEAHAVQRGAAAKKQIVATSEDPFAQYMEKVRQSKVMAASATPNPTLVVTERGASAENKSHEIKVKTSNQANIIHQNNNNVSTHHHSPTHHQEVRRLESQLQHLHAEQEKLLFVVREATMKNKTLEIEQNETRSRQLLESDESSNRSMKYQQWVLSTGKIERSVEMSQSKNVAPSIISTTAQAYVANELHAAITQQGKVQEENAQQLQEQFQGVFSKLDVLEAKMQLWKSESSNLETERVTSLSNIVGSTFRHHEAELQMALKADAAKYHQSILEELETQQRGIQNMAKVVHEDLTRIKEETSDLVAGHHHPPSTSTVTASSNQQNQLEREDFENKLTMNFLTPLQEELLDVKEGMEKMQQGSQEQLNDVKTCLVENAEASQNLVINVKELQPRFEQLHSEVIKIQTQMQSMMTTSNPSTSSSAQLDRIEHMLLTMKNQSAPEAALVASNSPAQPLPTRESSTPSIPDFSSVALRVQKGHDLFMQYLEEKSDLFVQSTTKVLNKARTPTTEGPGETSVAQQRSMLPVSTQKESRSRPAEKPKSKGGWFNCCIAEPETNSPPPSQNNRGAVTDRPAAVVVEQQVSGSNNEVDTKTPNTATLDKPEVPTEQQQKEAITDRKIQENDGTHLVSSSVRVPFGSVSMVVQEQELPSPSVEPETDKNTPSQQEMPQLPAALEPPQGALATNLSNTDASKLEAHDVVKAGEEASIRLAFSDSRDSKLTSSSSTSSSLSDISLSDSSSDDNAKKKKGKAKKGSDVSKAWSSSKKSKKSDGQKKEEVKVQDLEGSSPPLKRQACDWVSSFEMLIPVSIEGKNRNGMKKSRKNTKRTTPIPRCSSLNAVHCCRALEAI